MTIHATVHGVDLVRAYRAPTSFGCIEHHIRYRSTNPLLSVISCYIDRHFMVTSGLTLSSIQTLAFQHLFRLSRWSSDDELRENEHYHEHWVRLGQISKFKFFLQKHAYLVQFCLRIPQMSFIVMYDS